MSLRGLVKCANIFFFIFLMCPKQSRLSAPIGKQQEYFHAVRKSLNEVNDPSDMKLVPAHWSSDIIKNDQGDGKFLGVDDEPGFDLSDEEIKKFKLWPKGIIPYYIDVLSFNDKVLRDRIRLFLNVINSVTRISFLELPSPPKDESTRWVFFVNRRGQLGCGDHSIMNFTNEGVQHVLLGYDCMSTGGELAEAVLSIAGIPPQHNAPNRDKYIKVVDENILPGKKYLFQKLKYDQWLFYDIKYDFSSAGHFHYHKHSVNGRATIVTQPQYRGISMGENNGFSISDIAKLRMLYNYIVKKKENKVPECKRLFMPGPNFKHRRPSFPDNKPRKKPHQYLGLSKEQAEIDSQDKRSSDYGNDNQSGDSNNDDYTNNKTGDEENKLKKLKGGGGGGQRNTPRVTPSKTSKATRPTLPEFPELPETDEEEKLKKPRKGGGGGNNGNRETGRVTPRKPSKATRRPVPELTFDPPETDEEEKLKITRTKPTKQTTKPTKSTKSTKPPTTTKKDPEQEKDHHHLPNISVDLSMEFKTVYETSTPPPEDE